MAAISPSRPDGLFQGIPPEIDHSILSYLDRQSLCRSSAVNRGWWRQANDDSLWRLLFPRLIAVGGIKAYLGRYGIRANTTEEVISHIARFLLKLRPGDHGEFICLFTADPRYIIRVELQTGSKYPEPNIKDYCLSLATFRGRSHPGTCRIEDRFGRNPSYLSYCLKIPETPQEQFRFGVRIQAMLNEQVDRHEAFAPQQRCCHITRVAAIAVAAVGSALGALNYLCRISF